MSQNLQTIRSQPAALTVVLTGGGSGGHITPLLSLARELKSRKNINKLIYIGFKGDSVDVLKEEFKIFDKTNFIRAGKFRRYSNQSWLERIADLKTFFLNAKDIFNVFIGFWQARKILKESKPNVILLKGGFVSVPVALAASGQRIPTLTHDSDSMAGLANRIAGRWAVMHATGMPAQFYDYPPEKIRYVGIPLDDRIKKVNDKSQASFKNELEIHNDYEVLLVTGGGLGSMKVNELILSIVPNLLADIPKLFLLHITGVEHIDEVLRQYEAFLDKNDVSRIRAVGYTPEFYKFSGAADVVVTRAGATSLATFAAQAKACIVIPSPYLSAGHQIKNAKEYSDNGSVIMFDENDEPEKLLKIIEDLLRNKKERLNLAEKLASTSHLNATQKLTDLIIEVANK